MNLCRPCASNAHDRCEGMTDDDELCSCPDTDEVQH